MSEEPQLQLPPWLDIASGSLERPHCPMWPHHGDGSGASWRRKIEGQKGRKNGASDQRQVVPKEEALANFPRRFVNPPINPEPGIISRAGEARMGNLERRIGGISVRFSEGRLTILTHRGALKLQEAGRVMCKKQREESNKFRLANASQGLSWTFQLEKEGPNRRDEKNAGMHLGCIPAAGAEGEMYRPPKNGYVCLMFHRRDEHVIEMQLSEWSQQPDDVCNSSTFNSHSTPYTTFITSEPMTRQCPNFGRYEVVSLLPSRSFDNAEDVLGVDGEQNMVNAAEVQDAGVTSAPLLRPCNYDSVRRLDIGCKTPDRMELATSCIDEELSEYMCHGSWIENGTVYLVASTDIGRYCFVYSASAATTGSSELSVTGHLASCPRASPRHPGLWQVNLTLYAQCGDISLATSWTYRVPASVFNLVVLLGVLFGRYIAR
ncbi:hypothetical protein KM043_012759 [Ampulex compressa]|nr:hypothetical protein KM043_012759 [Ampulex compressa]